ncbi:MAG: hypothetical protein ACLQBQ_11145 [Smithella sp.]
MIPPPPKPQPFFVAVADLLGFKRHLWNQERVPLYSSLENLYEIYTLLLHALDWATKIDRFELTPENGIQHVNLKINHFVASDTILLWSVEQEVNYLLGAVANLIGLALGFGAPLRGALSYGDCILDLNRRIFIGYPIVEAIEAEKCQGWVGIAVLSSAAARLNNSGNVVRYDVPIKSSYNKHIRYAVPWHWAEEAPNASEIKLKRMLEHADEKDRVKYLNALDFVLAVPST